MKKFLLITLLTILTGFAHSQCKYETNEIDEFTGKKRVETKVQRVAGTFTTTIAFQFRKVDSTYFAQVAYAYTPGATIIPEGSDMLIKMGSGEILTLKALKTSVSKTHYVSGISSTSINMPYSLTKSQLEKLASDEISKFRIYFTDTYREEPATEKGKKSIKELANCILQI